MVADVARVRHRPDQGEMVGQLGQARVQLADLHAGDGRGDRLVRAADLRRASRFEVPGVDVAGPPHSKMKMHDFSAAPPLDPLIPSTRPATMPGRLPVQEAGPAELEHSAAQIGAGFIGIPPAGGGWMA